MKTNDHIKIASRRDPEHNLYEAFLSPEDSTQNYLVIETPTLGSQKSYVYHDWPEFIMFFLVRCLTPPNELYRRLDRDFAKLFTEHQPDHSAHTQFLFCNHYPGTDKSLEYVISASSLVREGPIHSHFYQRTPEGWTHRRMKTWTSVSDYYKRLFRRLDAEGGE